MLNAVKITFYPAGHMLGSAQFLMEHDGTRYLYTGDFKTVRDPSCETFEYISSDVLITETTFADPAYIHPDPHKEIEKINTLEGKNFVIGAYTIGKAQRISRLASERCLAKKIFVHPDIIPYHRLYEEYNFPVGTWEPYDRKITRGRHDCILVVPPAVYRRYARNKNYYTLFATGWEWAHRRSAISLRISDHADWNDILRVIEKTSPGMVLTVHGSGKHLKEHFQHQGPAVIELA
jgi:putative mRNA 3-end processing factor